MTEVVPVSRQLWSDWFYRRVRLPPLVFGVLLTAGLLALLALLAVVTGTLEHLTASGASWWETRDGRVTTLLCLMAGIVPTALRYHELGTRRNLDALARSGLWPGRGPAALREATSASPRRALLFGATGFLLIPLVALTVDLDPGLYFDSDYWGLPQTWIWVVGCFVTFCGGVLTYRVYVDARTFGRLARELPEVDLLDREALLPFARQGLRSAVPGVIFATFLVLNWSDPAFLVAVVSLGAIVLVQNVAVLLIPVRGLHDRLREAKREELARVNAAIRAQPGALEGSPLARRPPPDLADLLAWRRFVESVPEWPIDVSTLGRFALYVGIPLLSWVGAALVEHVVELVIG